MKYPIITLLFLFFSNLLLAQSEVFEVDGEEKKLTYDVNSKLSLLVDDSSRNYIMYLQKDDQIKELSKKNYKKILSNFTKDDNVDTKNVDFTLKDIRNFVLDYNAQFDDQFAKTPSVSVRLSFLGGVSNYNAFLPREFDDRYLFQGIGLEFYNKEKFNRHSLIVQARKSVDQGDFDVDVFEIGIGYRFKIINTKRFHLYFESEFFNLHKVEFEQDALLEENEIPLENQNDYEIEPSLGLGGGLAYRVAKGFYLTANYNNIVFLGLDDNGESPIDIRFGVKFDL